ncbi:MAG: hypothetical protein HYT87_13135 [Nitrospirae bacterium]|nr:hypothetical protein [Nitrospirota bacterium]
MKNLTASESTGTEPHPEKQETRSFLRIGGAHVYVADILTQPAGNIHTLVLARFYGAREAVKAVASGLWLRKEVFFCRDENADGKVLEQLEQDHYISTEEGIARLRLELDLKYERSHSTVRTGVSMMTLLHPQACGQIAEERSFYVIVPRGEDPLGAFVRAANRAVTIPIPSHLAGPLWKRMQTQRDIIPLHGRGQFEGFSVRTTPRIKEDVTRIVRAQAKVVNIEDARHASKTPPRAKGRGERPIRQAA